MRRRAVLRGVDLPVTARAEKDVDRSTGKTKIVDIGAAYGNCVRRWRETERFGDNACDNPQGKGIWNLVYCLASYQEEKGAVMVHGDQ
jgi:hypothetical protein